jgi:hypothetical protein
MPKAPEEDDGWTKHAREQLHARLAMTYAERLRWLEQMTRFTQAALGAARPKP